MVEDTSYSVRYDSGLALRARVLGRFRGRGPSERAGPSRLAGPRQRAGPTRRPDPGTDITNLEWHLFL